MSKRINSFHNLVICLSLALLFQACAQCDNIGQMIIQTTVFFKSTDSSYQIDHLVVSETGYSTTKNSILNKNELVLPLNKKQLTVFCYAKNGRTDTLVLNNIYTLTTHKNDVCGDDYEMSYRRTEVSISGSTFHSANLKYGTVNYNSNSNYQGNFLKDTLFLKP